jgi:putative heme transporter
MTDVSPPETSGTPGTPGDSRLPAWAIRLTSWNVVLLTSAAVFAGIIWLCDLFSAAMVPATIALLGTALLEPVCDWLIGRGLSRSVAAGGACVALVVVVGGTVWFVVVSLVNTAVGIGKALSKVSTTAGSGSSAELLTKIAQGLHDLGSGVVTGLLSGVVHGLTFTAQALAGFVLGLALVFFFLRDGNRFAGFAASHLAPESASIVVRVARRAYTALAGFMRGTTMIALIDSTLIFIGLLILRVPGSAGLAALVFIGAYIPFVGAFLSGSVAVLVALGDQGWGTALWTLAVVLAVQAIEGNFLQPIIQSRTVRLHAGVVMAAVAAGAAVSGILGALLAVPLTAAGAGMLAELRDVVAEQEARE